MVGHSCEGRWNFIKILLDTKILFTASSSTFGKRAYDIGNIIVLWWINYYLIRQECENKSLHIHLNVRQDCVANSWKIYVKVYRHINDILTWERDKCKTAFDIIKSVFELMKNLWSGKLN